MSLGVTQIPLVTMFTSYCRYRFAGSYMAQSLKLMNLGGNSREELRGRFQLLDSNMRGDRFLGLACWLFENKIMSFMSVLDFVKWIVGDELRYLVQNEKVRRFFNYLAKMADM